MNNKKYRLKDIKPSIIRDDYFITVCQKLGFNVTSIEDEITEEQYNILRNKEFYKIWVKNSNFKPRVMSVNQYVKIAHDNNMDYKTLQLKELTEEEKEKLNSTVEIKSARDLEQYKPKIMSYEVFIRVCKECNIDPDFKDGKPLTDIQISRIKTHRDVLIANQNLKYMALYQQQINEFESLPNYKTDDYITRDGIIEEMQGRKDEINDSLKDTRKMEFVGPTNKTSNLDSKIAQAGLNKLYKIQDRVNSEYVGLSKFSKNVHSKKVEIVNNMIKKLSTLRGDAVQYQKQIVNKNLNKYLEKKRRQYDRFARRHRGETPIKENVQNQQNAESLTQSENNTLKR